MSRIGAKKKMDRVSAGHASKANTTSKGQEASKSKVKSTSQAKSSSMGKRSSVRSRDEEVRRKLDQTLSSNTTRQSQQTTVKPTPKSVPSMEATIQRLQALSQDS